MFIHFIYILTAYQQVIIRLWKYQKKLIFTFGTLYVVGIIFSFIFMYQYEVAITEFTLKVLNDLAGLNVKQARSSDYSFLFVLEVFSYRACLIILIFFILHFAALTISLPLYYMLNMNMIRKILGKDIKYSFSTLWKLYKVLFTFLISSGVSTIFYLFILLIFSFLPYINLLFVLLSILVLSHFMGIFFQEFARHMGNINLYTNMTTPYIQSPSIIGFFVVLSALIPVIGWFLVPLVHIPAIIYYFRSLSAIRS